MDRLEGMTILLAAVDHGSLSAASRELRIPLATVSRRVSELEEHLHIRLLLRGTRKLMLTEAGRAYVASCRRIMEDITEAERTATGEYRAPQGELIFSAPQVIGRMHALQVVVDFLSTYPDIRMRFHLADRVVNLLEEQIDVALRVGELPDSSLIATRVGVVRQILCASPGYLKIRGTPKKPGDLRSHCCVAYDAYGIAAGSSWKLGTGRTAQTVQIPSRLVVNSAEAAVIAATAGAGVVWVMSYLAEDLVTSGSLVRLLDGYEPASLPVSLIYPSQRQLPLKLRAFLDFATPRLRDRLGYENGAG
jgi:DNA-binding transcriptional LysR family regulator